MYIPRLPILSNFFIAFKHPSREFYLTVLLDDGNALPPAIALPTPQPAGPSVIALHDKSGRLSDPVRPCSFAMAFNPTAERKDKLKHRRLKLLIARLKRYHGNGTSARAYFA